MADEQNVKDHGILRGVALATLVPRLPSTLALVINEYTCETDDYVALHRMCSVLEVTARFLFVLLQAEVWQRRLSPEADFPDPFIKQLLQHLERPTLASWRALIEAAVAALPDRDGPSLVPGLRPYVHEFTAALGVNKDDPHHKLLPMRNLLAHNLHLSEPAVSEFLHDHTQTFEGLVNGLAFLSDAAGVALVASPYTGPARLLRGQDAFGTVFDRSQLPVEFRQSGPDRMLLVTPNGTLDLFPLHAFGEVFKVVKDQLEDQGEDAIHIYARATDLSGPEYTTLGSKAAYSRGAPVWEEQFAEIFRLEAWRARFRVEGALAKYSFQERMDSLLSLFVGRDSEAAAAAARIEALPGGVLWLMGKPGMGKSAFMAKLVRDYFQQDAETGVRRADVICIPYFFQSSDGDRCRTTAFAEAALLRLAQATGRDLKPEDEPQKRLRQLRLLLEEVARTEAQGGRKIVILVDGVDEALTVDAHLLDLIFDSQWPGVVWVCAGRDEEPLMHAFSRDRCGWLFERNSPFQALRVGRGEEEGFLPPLKAENVRGVLIEELGHRVPQFFARDKRQADGSWSNEYVDAVIQRSGGLPLYLRLLVQDFLAERIDFAPGSERHLPDGLEKYYDRITAHMGDDLAATVPAITSLLALAYEPLPLEALAVLLADHELVGQPDGRDLLDKALRHGTTMLQRRPNAAGILGFDLYHDSYKQHIRNNERLRRSLDKARARFCQLVVNWRTLEPGSAALLYALRFGPKHLVEAGDWKSLGTILQDDDFWQARRRGLETVDALLGTQDLSQALARHGVCRWQELYACAYRYCDVAETLRGDAQSLPHLINDGKVELACRLVEADPDPIRRGVFKLSMAMLLAGTNRQDEAIKLWYEGEALVGPDQPATDELMPRVRNPLRSLGLLTQRLVRALLAKGAVAVQQASVQAIPAQGGPQNDHIPTQPLQTVDAPPRSTIPLPFLVMGYLSVTRGGIYCLFFVLLFSMVVFGWGAIASLFDAQLDEFLRQALPLLVLPGFFLACWFLSPAFRRVFWLCMDRRFTQVVVGFDAAIDRAPSITQKRTLLLRLMRFLAHADLSNYSEYSLVDIRPWCAQLCDLLARHFRPDIFADTPRHAALVMLYGTAIGNKVCDATIDALWRFTPRQVEAVQGELWRHPLLMLGNWRLLRVIVMTAYRSPKPDLLFRFMRVNRKLAVGHDDYQFELAGLPPLWLGKAILHSMSQGEGSRLSRIMAHAAERFFNLLGNIVSYQTLVTFSNAERAIVLGCLAPPFILGFLLIYFVVNFYALFYVYDLIVGWSLLTGRLHDPYHFSRRAMGTAREWRRRLLEELEPLSGSGIGVIMWRLATLDIRRLKTLILAQEIVRGGLNDVLRGGLTPLDFASRKALSCAMAALVRNPELMAQRASLSGADVNPVPADLPATILLQVMGDRVLLQGLQTYRPPPVRAGAQNGTDLRPIAVDTERLNEQQSPDDSRDMQELLRMLPLQPLWRSLTWVTILALAGTLVWLGGLWLLPTPEFHAFIWPYGVATALGICLYFAVLQHVPPLHFFRSPESTPSSPYGTGRGLIALILSIWIGSKIWGCAEASGVPQPGYDYGSDWVFALLILSPLWIANVLAPELIARWRGAGLFYPTPTQLWWHRVVWTVVGLAGCLLLAALVSFAASGPSHSYARARVYFEKAKSSFANGDYDSAIAQFDEAIPMLDDAVAHNTIKNPVNAEAYWLRCAAHVQKGDLDKAIADCSVAIRREPTALRYRYRCWLYSRKDQLDEAIADCTEAARRKGLADTDLANTYGAIARYQLLLERPAKAIEASLKGLRIDPHQTWITTNLAHGYLFDRQYAAAWRIYVAEKNVKINDRQTFAEVVLDDFQQFRERGLVPPEVAAELAKIESLMKEPN